MLHKKVLVSLLLIDLLALTAYAIYADGGLMGFYHAVVTNGSPWVWQITADLVIALILLFGFIFSDAKRKELAKPTPYAVLTMALGSIAPLIYMLRRPSRS